jgi:glutaredoxin
VVYAKAAAPTNLSSYSPPSASPRPTSGQQGLKLPTIKTVVTIALLALIGYGGYQFFSGLTITRETPGNMDTTSPITAPDKTVLLYSSTGCKYCKQAKEFLDDHKIRYEEIDVYNSERGKEDFAKFGAMGVPILVVANVKIVGFDASQLKSVLKSNGMW